MSTRAYVGYLTKSGSFKYIYVHNDGYPEGVGQTLLDSYDMKKTKELIKLGCASSIHEKLYPSTGSGHHFDNREDNVCVFYGRDRGEKDPAHTMKRLDLEKLFDSVIEYVYVLFPDGVWYVSTVVKNLIRLEDHPEISKKLLTT